MKVDTLVVIRGFSSLLSTQTLTQIDIFDNFSKALEGLIKGFKERLQSHNNRVMLHNFYKHLTMLREANSKRIMYYKTNL